MSEVFHSPILDVVVGLFFMYAVLSLFCTVLNEWIAALTQLRARSLQCALFRLLDNSQTGLGSAFYRHPAIQTVIVAGRGRPAYLPPKLVARVLADIIVGPCPKLYAWQRAINDLPACRLRRTLTFLLADAQPDAAPARLAAWFEESMDHLSAWYKGRLQLISCAVAVTVCIAVDADTLRIAHLLWGTAPALPLPLAGRNAGWLLSVIAVSRGAPFWFDTLTRVARAPEERS